jgi:hypothetical protein
MSEEGMDRVRRSDRCGVNGRRCVLGEVRTEDATVVGGGFRLAILPAVGSDDSPLGHAIRRRQQELAHPDEVVIATHDSAI